MSATAKNSQYSISSQDNLHVDNDLTITMFLMPHHAHRSIYPVQFLMRRESWLTWPKPFIYQLLLHTVHVQQHTAVKRRCMKSALQPFF